jgi:microcystin-dependent protein
MEPFIGQIILFGGNFAPKGWAHCNGQLLSISHHQALFSLLGTTYGGNGTTNFALPDLRGRAPIGMGHGPGLSPVQQGHHGGQEKVQLSVSNLPAHNHNINFANSSSAKADINTTAKATINASATGTLPPVPVTGQVTMPVSTNGRNNSTTDPSKGVLAPTANGNVYAASSNANYGEKGVLVDAVATIPSLNLPVSGSADVSILTKAPIVGTAVTDISGGNVPVNNMQPYLGMNYCIALEGIYPSRD